MVNLARSLKKLTAKDIFNPEDNRQSVPSEEDIKVTNTDKKATTPQSPNTPQNVYNVNIGGKDYATTDPNFRPAEKGTTETAKVNPNDTIDFTPKGTTETTNITKEEYAKIQSDRRNNSLMGRNISPHVDTSKLGQIEDVQPTKENIVISGKEAVSMLKQGVTYGTIGAGLGSVVLGLGTAVGAGGGFALGALTNLFNNIEADRSAIASGKYSNFRASKSQVSSIVQLVKEKWISSDAAIDAYNQNLRNIKQAEADIYAISKDLTDEKLAKAQSDLTNIKIYLENEPLRRLRFDALLQNPSLPAPTETDITE